MSSYINANFTKHIKKDINVIIECGSRDCEDAIKMLDYYNPNKIWSFECNPDSVKVCLENIKNYPITTQEEEHLHILEVGCLNQLLRVAKELSE